MSWSRAGRAILAFAATLGVAACGFQLRGEAAPGISRLQISADGPSFVTADLRRILATGPTRLVDPAGQPEAHLRILGESREKSVFTLTGAGRVYEFQLRLVVRYQLARPGAEDPVIPPTEIEARRLITYSETAPVAKEAEEQILYKDMQVDLARQMLRHVAAVTRPR